MTILVNTITYSSTRSLSQIQYMIAWLQLDDINFFSSLEVLDFYYKTRRNYYN